MVCIWQGGDLTDAIRSSRNAEFGWFNRGRSVALDIARGLEFLHSNRIVHCDLKSKNIMLTAVSCNEGSCVGCCCCCSSLQDSIAAHGQGVGKITTDGVACLLQGGEPKISDVGLSKMMHGGGGDERGADACFGTFAWAAPEVNSTLGCSMADLAHDAHCGQAGTSRQVTCVVSAMLSAVNHCRGWCRC